MARTRITFVSERQTGPLTFWVHRPLDNDVWVKATRFEPELPPAQDDRGFPLYIVEHQGHEVLFASTDELRRAIDVLGRDRLPSPEELAAEAGRPERAYMHWIATFPARLKAENERQRFVKLLAELLEKIEAPA